MIEEIANEVMIAGQTASLLEVSAYPKPGNVHRTRDFSDMRYEHFLVGSASLGPVLRGAAMEGARGKVELGKYIKKGIFDVDKHHLVGNTHLGTCMLLIPLAAAGGKTIAQKRIGPRALRGNLISILSSTTSQDSVDVYDAIMCGKNWLGNSGAFDVFDRSTRARLREEGIALKEWMAISDWDAVARELTTGMEISFGTGYPFLKKNFEKYGDINVATVHAYLKILSEIPDSFIARKVGLKRTSAIDEAVKIGKEETEWVSEEARSILELGGLTTEEGKKKLYQFDETMHKKGLNPGTTADLTASSLMIALLLGLRF